MSLDFITPQLIERFEKYYDRGGEEDCWEWKGGTCNGYGRFTVTIGKSYKTHVASRVSWMIYKGTIPPNLYVLHRCDNPPCINPNHLFLGTKKDNTRDMIAKGREWLTFTPGFQHALGENHHSSKLTRDQVDSIRFDPRSCRSLGKIYDVSAVAIHKIKTEKSWRV